MPRVCVLDYGSGNVRSVYNLFSSIADDVVVSNDPSVVRDVSHLVLPGVGAFGPSMRKIKDKLPLDTVEEAVLDSGKPFLGVCVGMQVLANVGTEFGEHEGLGWIPGKVRKLYAADLPLPHNGWNNVCLRKNSPLLSGLEGQPDFYFVHSYVFEPEEPDVVVATSDFGEQFCAVVQRENIFGVQFHPEKSQRAGVRLAQNFLAFS